MRKNLLLLLIAHKTTQFVFYTFEHCNPHKMRIVFKGNVTDKLIKTHTKCANLNVHRCIKTNITTVINNK